MAAKTLVDLFERRVSESGDAVALRHYDDGMWKPLSWSRWLSGVTRMAAGLIALGVERGDRIAILSRTRLEWVFADQAALAAGASVVPLYHSTLPRQISIILRDAGATILFVEDPHQLERVLSVRDELPGIRHVITFDELATLDAPDEQGRAVIRLDDVEAWDPDDPWVLTLSRLLELGAAAIGDDPNVVLDRRRHITADDIASIVYTSGTTGRPRGVVLTHANFVAEVEANALALPLDEQDEQILFLPLSHIFARVTYLTAVHTGCVTTFSRGLQHLATELRQVRPTLVVGVPRVFEKVFERVVNAGGVRPDGVRRRAVERTVGLATRVGRGGRSSLGLLDRAAFEVADRALLARVREFFGGRLRFAVSGGAPLSEDLCAFFHGAGVLLLEGFGLTENCAAATVNRPDDARIGTVGKPLLGVDVRIADDGEILLRGPNIMRGYWQDDAATAAALVDGWLHTGDIGEIEDGYLRVTDRKKDIIVTAGGKNIAPQPIETALCAIPYVDHALVHGDRRRYLTALVTLRRDTVEAWAAHHDLGNLAFEELRHHSRVFELIRQHIDEVNRELAGYETIKRFAILDSDFDPNSGELTPTWKTRRRFVTDKYRAVLDSLYDED